MYDEKYIWIMNLWRILKKVLFGQNWILNILFWFYKNFQKQMAANNDWHEQQMDLDDDESTSPAHYLRPAADGHNQLIDVYAVLNNQSAPRK